MAAGRRATWINAPSTRPTLGAVTRISDLLSAGRTYSFEFFPPKSDQEHLVLSRTLLELQPLSPSFVSVTYRGGAASRQRTFDLVSGMLHTTSLNPMAHLICVAHSRLELADILVSLRKAGVENLMALGGDPPTDPDAAEIRGQAATALVRAGERAGVGQTTPEEDPTREEPYRGNSEVGVGDSQTWREGEGNPGERR